MLTRTRRGLLGSTAIVGALTVAVGLGVASPSSIASADPVAGSAGDPAAGPGRHSYTGEIDGAKYRVETPEDWNGTLVLFSHGAYVDGMPAPERILLSNRPETESWLLENGYAVAGSEFKDGGVGHAVEEALVDQVALLDWFEEEVAEPRRTVATGMSLGAQISTLLAERNPGRIDGIATLASDFDGPSSWNVGLDITFVVKTLLAPDADIELVRPADADEALRSSTALSEAIEDARATADGRARLALAGAMANLPTWYAALEAEPSELVDRIVEQSKWSQYAYAFGMGPLTRLGLEQRAGGNPSSNVDVDYRRQLVRSSERALVRQAYRAAPKADLIADLKALATAPRIAADEEAVGYMRKYGVPDGTAAVPQISLHTTGDGGATNDHERWYADRVRRHGVPANLRQIYTERGGHASLSAAEEIVAFQALIERLDSGRWPSLRPDRLDARAAEFGPEFHIATDIGMDIEGPVRPAFTRFVPPRPQRPST